MDLSMLYWVGTFVFLVIMKKSESKWGGCCPKCGVFNRVALIKQQSPIILIYSSFAVVVGFYEGNGIYIFGGLVMFLTWSYVFFFKKHHVCK